MAIFLDNGLGGGVSIIKAKINSLIVHADLTRSGFLFFPFFLLAKKNSIIQSYSTEYTTLQHITSLPICGFIAQLVEHCTSTAEVNGLNPVEALIFLSLLLSSYLSRKFTAMIIL